jgi:ABC-type phosphate transport system, permease component
MDDIQKRLQEKSKATFQDYFGKGICYLCIGLIILLVVCILYFIASKGLATFTKDKVNVWDFLTKTNWNPGSTDAQGHPDVGALPMIVTSFSVTLGCPSSNALCPWNCYLHVRIFQ